MRRNELKELIRKKVREQMIKDEVEGVDEATTTSNIDGYQTPHAFSKDGEEDEDRIDRIIGSSSGYTRVKK